MKQIKVIIDPNGEVTMEGSGFKGTACDQAMNALEKSLGIQTKRINKPEYTAQSSVGTSQKQTT